MAQRPILALATAFLLFSARSALAEAPESPPPETPSEPAKGPASPPDPKPEPAPGGWKPGQPLPLSMMFGIITGGVGVLAFAPGGALIGYGTSVGSDADALASALPARDACLGENKHADCETIQANLKTEEDFVTAGTATMAIGGLLICTSVMLIVTAIAGPEQPTKDDKAKATMVVPWIGTDGAGAMWGATF